jgi:UDP-3-O-[3-hydroxymyristoyl] glucosamine N-acyltransferase
MPVYTLSQIAESLGLPVRGDGTVEIAGVAEPAMAGPRDLALAMKPAFADGLRDGQARAAMLWDGADWQGMGLEAAILSPRPRFAMAKLSAMVDPGQGYAPGVHPSAVIDPSAHLGEGVSVGPLCVIGPEARIGAGTVIGPQCHIGWQAQLGPGCQLREAVRIGARVTLGARVIAQPGATVGADGFSFVTPEVSGVEQARETLGSGAEAGAGAAQAWARIHSLGSVTVGDDVEIGANACIDRGTVRDTVVGAGTKIDNLAQIGHNVIVGRDCMICAQVGIAGSTRVGNNVVLGGQTGVSDNIFIGDNVITGGATKVLSNVPAGRVMLGYPAMKMETHVEVYKALRRLPRLFRDVADLRKGIQNQTKSD